MLIIAHGEKAVLTIAYIHVRQFCPGCFLTSWYARGSKLSSSYITINRKYDIEPWRLSVAYVAK